MYFQPDVHKPDVKVCVGFDKKIRWIMDPNDGATGPRDIWAHSVLYQLAMSYLRQYHTDINSDGNYSARLDQYFHVLEM